MRARRSARPISSWSKGRAERAGDLVEEAPVLMFRSRSCLLVGQADKQFKGHPKSDR